MKLLLMFAGVALAGSAHAQDPDRGVAPKADLDTAKIVTEDLLLEARNRCIGMIRRVRSEQELAPLERNYEPGKDKEPLFDRRPATPGEGLLVAAVDQRVDSCPVLVMHHDKSDWRPVPETRMQQVRVIEQDR